MLKELMIARQVRNAYVIYVEDRGVFMTTLYGPKHTVIASGYGATIEASMDAAVRSLPRTEFVPPSSAPLAHDLLPVLPGKDMTR